ncbi:MAG: hypothetical protein SOZ04_05265 [Bacilli bacterium]|nr:hypothetical protein [Bacilli bacterium]
MKNLTSLTHDKAFKAIAKECPEFFYNLLHLITGIDINRIKAGKLLDTKFINSKKRFKDLDLLFMVDENLIINIEVSKYNGGYNLTKNTSYFCEVHKEFCRNDDGSYKSDFQVIQIVLCQNNNVGNFLIEEEYLYAETYYGQKKKIISVININLDKVADSKYNKDVSKELLKYLTFLSITNKDELEKLSKNHKALKEVLDYMIKFDRKHGIVIRDEEDEFQAIMASERREARELGLSEGQERGIAIGEARGETRGIAIGEARGETRGIAIGEARGETRGIAIGEARGENKKTVESIRNMKSMGFEDSIIMQALNTDEYTLKNALSLKM